MNSPKKIIITSCLLLGIMLVSLASAEGRRERPSDLSAPEAFLKANAAYHAGKYQQAADLYEAVVLEKQNGYVYYNLGNCYFKMGRTGKAIINYRRAQKLAPRFEDLLSNLKYARQETKDKIESRGYSQIFRKIFFWYYPFNKKELIVTFLALNFLFFLVAGIRIYSKADFIKWIFVLVSIVYILSGASAITRIYADQYKQEGVVTSLEVSVRSGDGINNIVLFKLHEGTEFIVKEVKQNWLKIELSDGKKGWAPKTGVDIRI